MARGGVIPLWRGISLAFVREGVHQWIMAKPNYSFEKRRKELEKKSKKEEKKRRKLEGSEAPAPSDSPSSPG